MPLAFLLRFFVRGVMPCLWLVWALVLTGPATAQPLPPTRYVDPFIGSDGAGHVFPGASVPFGMVAPSPDNANRGGEFSSGYQFRAPRFLGFSNTHSSGSGVPELGDVLLQPIAGTPWSTRSTDFSAAPDKASERASPGYYTVTLPAHGVRVEMTATQRVALHRWTFGRSPDRRVQVLVDLQHGLHAVDAPRVAQAQIEVDAAAGQVSGTVFSRNWVERQASFVVRFDHPAVATETLPAREGERAPRLLLTFELAPDRVLQAQVALSTVDVDGARKNLGEPGALRFDRVRSDATHTWDQLLGRIGIGATEAQRRLFYTSLYHAMLHPSDIADADGRVRGPTGAVIDAAGGSYYSTLSLGATFRAVHPLLTLLAPERINGFVQTMIDHHRAMQTLPLWTVWGRETWHTIGNPALPVIADAVIKGFRGFDDGQALQAMVVSATEPRLRAPPRAQFDWALLDRHGWLPFDKVDGESVSKTLEAGIGDDAVARVARALGRNQLALAFSERAQAYRQLLDPDTRLMRARDSMGGWRTPFDPVAAAPDYSSGNAWQATLTPALHDPRGMVDLMGGHSRFGDWLDRFFTLETSAAGIGQYRHDHLPSHHVPWLYAYSDRPWRSHETVRRIARSFYGQRPDGIVGADAGGQMGAWYVFATIGLYPVVPGSAHYVFGAPLVRLVRIELPGDRLLEIRAPLLSERHRHAGTITIDGERWMRPEVPHWMLAKGGLVEFSMRPPPAP
jgi:predicted alpha-1,2-mannosidase